MANAWQRLVRGFVRAQIDKYQCKKKILTNHRDP